MSQVIKHQQGSGSNGIQPGATPSPSGYNFKVNGNDYKTDEQSIRDKFEPFFSDLVQKGEAHERDRDKWVGTYNRLIDNVKKGQYELTSSGGHLYQGKYDGNATPSDLGLNADGTTARKSVVGNFIGRANKSDSQRMSMLDHYFGNSVIGGYNSKVQADAKTSAEAKAKADADAAKAKEEAGKTASDFYKNNQRGFGESQFGSNYTNPATKAMTIGDQYWGPNVNDSQRYQMMLGHYSKQYKSLYDTSNDANLDPDTLKRVKAQREMGMQFYDPTKGKFNNLPRMKHLDDFEQLSNPFGLAGEDAAFYNKNAYDKMLHPDGTEAAKDAPLKPLTQSGNLWTDGTTYWKDKDRKELAQKWINDESGHPRLFDDSGHPVDKDFHLENANPDSPFTGYFVNGYKRPTTEGQNYMNSLTSSPVNDETLKRVQGNYSTITSAYDKVINSDSWLKAGDNKETSDASYNIWAPYQKHNMAPKQTSDETAKYQGLEGGKANVQMYISQHQNDYGRPKVFRMITLPSQKQYKGSIQTDLQGNVTGMLNEDGQPITDPELVNTLKGVKYNHGATNTNPSNTIYNGGQPSVSAPVQQATNQNMLDASRKSEFKEGGVVKAQGGASINNTQAFDNTASTKVNQSTTHEANVGDISRSLSDPQYHLSGSDKAELAALGLNLGSLAASFTGVGSTAAVGLGAAGSLTQFGADTSREGFKLGNLGQLGISLGLDAASAIPGVGVWADSTKVGKTLAKMARFLVPALTAYGMGKAAGTVYDLASGKKKITDLNMDDLRDLTNGIHGIVGGARYTTAKLGTTRALTSTIKLADGTPVPLDAAGEAAIRDAADPASVAKSVVARLTGKSADEIQLDQKRSPIIGINPLKWKLNNKVDNPELISNKGAIIPKDINKYQGNGMWNGIMRGAINRSTNRMMVPGAPLLDPKYRINDGGDIEQSAPGQVKADSWNTFGSYMNKSKTATGEDWTSNSLAQAVAQRRQASGGYTGSAAEPTYEYEAGKTATVGDIPDTRRIFGSMFGMNKFDNERSVSFQQVRNRLKGLTGSAGSRQQLTKFLDQDFSENSFSKNIQDQIKQAMADPGARGYVKFKQGGKVPKAQDGFEFKNPNKWMMDDDQGGGGATQIEQPTDPSQLTGRSMTVPSRGLTMTTPMDNVTSPGGYRRPPIGDVAPGQRSFSLPKFQINPAMASEFARAIASSNINKMYDTRVERPMISAPQEVPISVHGNLFAQATANKQADNLVRGSQEFKSSDGTMQMLGNLEAQKQAADLRFQGGMQSNQTLQQTRQQALQSAIQNAQARMSAANENTHTNASATQAERQQENLKRTMVAQPMLDFWQNANDRAQMQYQQGRDLDTQISGISEEQKVRVPMQQLQLAANNVWYDEKIPQEQKMAKYTEYMNAMSALQSRLSQKLLQYRKDPYGTQGGTAEGYMQGLNLEQLLAQQPVSKASGGSMWRIQAAQLRANADISKAGAKENADEGKSVMEDETKKQIAAMKGINDLIKMALK